MSDFITDSTPRAKRPHTCCECQGLIRPGEKYQRTAGRWDGRMDVFKTCTPCLETRDWATSQMEWGGGDDHLFYFEMLEDDLHNMAMEIHLGSGRRFKAYRLQILMARRREAARLEQAA